MFSKMLSNEMCILHLSQAIYTETYKLLQDPMSHYMDFSLEFSSGILSNRTFALHIQTDTFFWLRWIDLSQK